MKKRLFAILLAAILVFAIAACGNKNNPLGDPEDTKSFEDAKKSMDNIEASEDKGDIEKTIKDVFGIDISLPKADEYSADTMSMGGASMYMIVISGSKVSDEEYYNSVKSKFKNWESNDDELAFAYETENVAYGAVILEEDDLFTITFSMTDKEIVNQFISNTDGFRNEIKRLSGLEITFPDIITSVGLASSYSSGSKVEYSGMLLSNNDNLSREEFYTVVNALTPQLTGYTKGEEEVSQYSTKVKWVNNSDSGKYFEIVLSDYDGYTSVDFGFCYTDRSLLVEWPADEIGEFLGVASALPAYSGDYRDLETSYSADWSPDEFTIEISGADEEEFAAWLASLVDAGFAVEEVEDEYYGNTETFYTKSINEGLYLTVEGRYSQWGSSYVYLTKEVYTNLEWPTEALTEAYGAQVAAAIPQVEKAPKRSFILENDNLRIENNISQELLDSIVAAVEEKGFELTYSSSYASYVTYSITFENWDKLSLTLELVEGYYDDPYIRISIDFDPYEGVGFNLPENVAIDCQTTYTYNGAQGEPFTERIVKIGENWYFTGSVYHSYYLFDESTRTWTAYIGYQDDDGTMNWSVDGENLTRANIDQKLKSNLSSLRLNSSAKETDPQQTEVINGVTCIQYMYSFTALNYRYEYWLDQNTNLVFKCIYTAETAATETVVTEYDTTVTSFADAGITYELPTE